jgi:CheY-like chemotaxis protein
VAPVRRVHSTDRLVDQAAFMLHREMAAMVESSRKLVESLHRSDKLLGGKKVLIVDDDMRNIFALTTVLEEHNMVIASADNGHAAIRILKEQPDMDIVLMDIMMPEMDGIDTMREIRKLSTFKDLPIVAVTAKAMKGDREKCIEAGAWDYLAKPVDTDQLLAVLRAWLHR